MFVAFSDVLCLNAFIFSNCTLKADVFRVMAVESNPFNGSSGNWKAGWGVLFESSPTLLTSMIFGFVVLAFLYLSLKQMAPDPQTQSFLLTVLVIALSLLSIASKDALAIII